MMTFGILFFLLFLYSLNAAAEPVSLEKALVIASDFVKAKKLIQKSGGQRLTLTYVQQGMNKAEEDDNPLFYVFNVGSDHGFVIVAGDDVATPILGYADDGTFDFSQAPDNMKVWLRGYADAITWARTQQLGSYKTVSKASSRVSVPYLVKAKWGQNSPYNLQIPKYSNKYCYTGCVATAMAQVMYYWATQKNYRHGANAIPAYTNKKTKTEIPALGVVDQFDWDNMTDAKPTTTEGKNAVAQLMRYCGQAVKMDYSPSGSSALPEAIPAAMHYYFGYDKRARLVSVFDINASQWEEILYHEIEAGRPVCMSGDNLYKGTSHEFVCDGYNASTDKYHFNWGWDGSNNGYFAINALNPTASSSYNDNKKMVVGIQPETGDETFQDVDLPSVKFLYLTGPRVLSRDNRTENGAQQVSLYGAWRMETACARLFDCACGIFDGDGRLVGVINPTTIKVVEYETRQFFYHFPFGAEYPYDNYTFALVCRVHGEDEWKKMNNAALKYATAAVSEHTISLSSSYDVVVNSLTSSADDGMMLMVTNRGTEETMGCLTFFIDGEETTWVEPHLKPGETKTIALNYKGEISASTQVVVLSDEIVRNRIYNNDDHYGDVLWQLSWDNYIDKNHCLYGDTCKARILINNKGAASYQQDIKATLFEWGGDPSRGVSQTASVSIEPMSSSLVSIDFGNFIYGTKYDLRLSFLCGDSVVNVDASELGLQVMPRRGVVAVCANDTLFMSDDDYKAFAIPDDARFVDARYSSKTGVVFSGGNDNTLFVFHSDVETSSSLAGRNVVTGGHSDKLTLVDGMEFSSPVDFEAEQISYTRIFEQGHGKTQEGWDTMVLPFDLFPENVTVDGEPMAWYINGEDMGLKFFLFGFDGDEEGQVSFTYVPYLQAYQPCIIAVPDDSWGKRFDLRGKVFVFNGFHAKVKAVPQKAVTTGEKYDFVGRICPSIRSRIHTLKPNGGSFAFTFDENLIPSFRAYFVSYDKKTAAFSMRLR